MEKTWRRALPPVVYALATLAIAYPLLGSGYIFALDHAMGPNSVGYYARFVTDNADPIQNKGAFALLLGALDLVLPLAMAQKLLFFAPFLLAGLGMHRLVRTTFLPAALLGGLLYTLSPFAYVRAVAGQIGVLWAYALAPWFLSAWFHARESGSRRSLAAAASLLALTAVFQAHGAFLLVALVAIHSLILWARTPRDWRGALRAPIALGLWTTLLSASWVVPVMLASETTLDRISEGDRAFFATSDAGLPSVGLAAITLQGFWRASYETYYDGALVLVPIVILLLAVHGFLTRRSARANTVAIAGVVGFVLGVGAASAWTRPIFDLAWDHVPFFRGFRDSHKLLALLALAYAYLGAGGADALFGGLRDIPGWRPTRGAAARAARAVPPAAALLLLAAPVVAAGPLLAGFDGQLGVAGYPDDWAEAEALTRDCDGKMLVLPWHLYLDLAWVPNRDHRITNPAKLYFTCPTLSSDNVEAGTTASQSSEPAARYADHWFADVDALRAREVRTLGNLLSPINVQYVLVLKEADWRAAASALGAQEDLTLRMENEHVIVYENEAERAAAWRTDAVTPLNDLDDLVPLSETMPLAGVIFAPDAAGLSPASGERVAVAAPLRASSAFDAEDAAPRYLVLAPPIGIPPSGWRVGGDPPITLSLGALPVFDTHATRVTPGALWWIAAPLWATSAVGAGALALWALAPPRPARHARPGEAR